MTDTIIFDLGEYGEIAVISTEHEAPTDEGLVQAGTGERLDQLKVKIQEVLQAPLTGMGMALRAALPEPSALDNDRYEIDQFSVQFEIGLTAEAGIVAKIVPSGSFACTYTWKRTSNKEKKQQ